MIRPHPRATRTDTLFPYTTLFRSRHAAIGPKALSVGAKAVLRSVWRSEYWPPSWMMHASTMKSSRRRAITAARSEEHTSELQSLMRISYAVFCLKKKTTIKDQNYNNHDSYS